MIDESQPAPMPTTARKLSEPARELFRRWSRRILYGLAVLAAIPVFLTLVYAVVPPPVSNVMLLHALSGNGIHKKWASLEQISPWLAKAVITSEDARFCEHYGVDWVEFGGVVEDAFDKDEGPIRGASTISMQTAKNLFLWDGRFFIRKILELPLALWMDLVWSKHRMLEIYLNIAEWGPGIYGAEAAAQYHFRKPAAKLTRREAALLAAALPNPIKRRAGKPSRQVKSVANRILIRMNGMGSHLACLGQ